MPVPPLDATSPQIADRFVDPISRQLMVDPVVCNDGRTYDRSTAARMTESPFTRQRLFVCTENVALRGELFEAYPAQLEAYRQRFGRTARPPTGWTLEGRLQQLAEAHARVEAKVTRQQARDREMAAALSRVAASALVGKILGQLDAGTRLTPRIVVRRDCFGGIILACEGDAPHGRDARKALLAELMDALQARMHERCPTAAEDSESDPETEPTPAEDWMPAPTPTWGPGYARSSSSSSSTPSRSASPEVQAPSVTVLPVVIQRR
ncbi:MAG TPA: U-box domain-containing protein [Myxococcota bacterium]|nr:U-box domain-containing protein [Myxococcota bacterium]